MLKRKRTGAPDPVETARLKKMLPLAWVLLTACGGGGGGSTTPAPVVTPPPAPPPVQSGFANGTFAASEEFRHLCEVPRTGDFPDIEGTTEDENNWLRSWSNELYLWYDEIEDRDPAGFETAEYFDLMKTFELTQTGAAKDNFHFTVPTDEWQQRTQSGITFGYGMNLAFLRASPPRDVRVRYTEPNSSAANGGIDRGARLISIDGEAVIDGDPDVLNAGLSPSNAGETHTFTIRDLGTDTDRTIELTSGEVTIDPVQFERVIDTDTGPVGYLFFSTHIAPAERDLVDAFDMFEAAGVTDLVIDLRYNGGGFLDIANETAAMIAGPGQSAGRIFDRLQFSDKHPNVNPVTDQPIDPGFFHTTTLGFSVGAGEPLPALNLSRVFVLSSGRTCSASEAIINGLRGIDVEVILFGDTTCGKPYGFYGFDNCGTTYFSIQFQGINEKGFGDYPSGFRAENLISSNGVALPGCFVGDDLNHPLGDPDETQLATALAYRANGVCPVIEPASVGAPGLDRITGDLHEPNEWPGKVMRP